MFMFFFLTIFTFMFSEEQIVMEMVSYGLLDATCNCFFGQSGRHMYGPNMPTKLSYNAVKANDDGDGIALSIS